MTHPRHRPPSTGSIVALALALAGAAGGIVGALLGILRLLGVI